MLEQGYFDDAFILHDETSHKLNLKHFFKINKKNREIQMDSIGKQSSENENEKAEEDLRKELHEEWGSFRKFCKYQPIGLVKNYFGESNAIYFAWLGILISTLLIPSFIGLLFFIIGIICA